MKVCSGISKEEEDERGGGRSEGGGPLKCRNKAFFKIKSIHNLWAQKKYFLPRWISWLALLQVCAVSVLVPLL
jgi:hypothetical protein